MRTYPMTLWLVTAMLAACSSSKSTDSDAATDTGATTTTTGTDSTTITDVAGPGSAIVDGTFLPDGATDAASLVVHDAIYVDSPSAPYIRITDYAGACAFINATPNSLKANSSNLQFTFMSAIAVGTVDAPVDVEVSYNILDGACDSNSEAVNTGTVTITSVDATGVQGTFDLEMGPGPDHITGAFYAATCAATQSTTIGSCVQ